MIILGIVIRSFSVSLFCGAWVHQRINRSPQPLSNLESSRYRRNQCSAVLLSSNSATVSDVTLSNDESDDEEEYEYVEYDILNESEFLGSEWLVGTVMDNRPERIVETWVRLATDRDGKNVAIWGDKSEGNWNFDVAAQFLSITKNSLVGKNIWAGVVDDYYFTRGTVRGWNFFSPASVVGQWQAKRLGVDDDEAGVAPWFDSSDGNNESESDIADERR